MVARRKRLLLSSCAAVILTVAAFGAIASAEADTHGIAVNISSSSTTAPTQERNDLPESTHDFIVAADARCRLAETNLDRAISDVTMKSQGKYSQAELIGAQLAVLQTMAQDLASMKPPSEIAQQWAEFTVSMSTLYARLSDYSKALTADKADQLPPEIEAERSRIVGLARELGLDSCWAPGE